MAVKIRHDRHKNSIGHRKSLVLLLGLVVVFGPKIYTLITAIFGNVQSRRVYPFERKNGPKGHSPSLS